MNEIEYLNIKIKILKSPFILFIKIFILLIFIGIFDIIISVSINYIELDKNYNNMFSYEEQLFLGSLLMQLIIIVYLFIKWSSDFYYFNDHKLLHITGIFFRKMHSFDIHNLDSISYHQTLIGRLFGYGNISLYFSNQKFLLKQIPDPKHFTKIINKYKKSL